MEFHTVTHTFWFKTCVVSVPADRVSGSGNLYEKENRQGNNNITMTTYMYLIEESFVVM